MKWSKHAKERLEERNPEASTSRYIIGRAVDEYIFEGYHPNVDFIIALPKGAKLYRFKGPNIEVYILVNNGIVITVYPASYVNRFKRATKFKKKARSRRKGVIRVNNTKKYLAKAEYKRY